jgi:hypothetical protein
MLESIRLAEDQAKTKICVEITIKTDSLHAILNFV